MAHVRKIFLTLTLPVFFLAELSAQQQMETQVLVIGGGTGGTAAAIQSARLHTKTILVESGPWLGGMLTAAGVSATDGNHRLPSGLWEEFRLALYHHYGSPAALETGWVSNTQFEPHVGDSIFKAMAAREKDELTILYGWEFFTVLHEGNKILGAEFVNQLGNTLTIRASITIDATELGDVLAQAGIGFNIGMEAGSETGEKVGVPATNDIVQDLTYVAILKDYGRGVDCTIVKPAGYDPAEFDAACSDYYINKSLPKPSVDAAKMLDYAKLPGNKYLLNWPNQGNDTYLHLINKSLADRTHELEKAKQTTLRFIYFIQQQLGFKHLGLATDEFPTKDGLALMPYYREGRRLNGAIRFSMQHIADPYGNGEPLYRTGIAVGDYPIDHHHKKNPAAPQHLSFYPVPSYTIPMGALIVPAMEGILVADKSISVSNVVNGTTRLQPVVLLTGQAAGVIAAYAIANRQSPEQVSVRQVQQQLLDQGVMIQPFLDVPPNHPQFQAIHRIGSTGLLQGKGIAYQWANQTWFYPDSTIDANLFLAAYRDFDSTARMEKNGSLSIGDAINLTVHTGRQQKSPVNLSGRNYAFNSEKKLTRQIRKEWNQWGFSEFEINRPILKKELALLLDQLLHPFESKAVQLNGHFKPF